MGVFESLFGGGRPAWEAGSSRGWELEPPHPVRYEPARLMEPRSVWTGRRSPSLRELRIDPYPLLGSRGTEQRVFIEPEHEAELRAFFAYARRWVSTFWMLLIASVVLAAGGAFLSVVWRPAIWGTIASVVVLGVMLLAFPFSTPQTIAWLGLRRSRRLARVVGLLFFAFAGWMAVLLLGST